MKKYPPLKVKVWGKYALFTRPEGKVERVSYPCITPSAARGILESIFWKPEFDWQIRRIRVLKPIRFESIMRNEVEGIIPGTVANATKADYYADEDRQQRNSLFLRDVAYVIEADIYLREHADQDVAKYRDMFRRRVKKGQCFNQPYLGTRECMGFFGEVDENRDHALPISFHLGSMLFDMKYPRLGSKDKVAIPIFFQAKLDDGVLEVPQDLYKEVR